MRVIVVGGKGPRIVISGVVVVLLALCCLVTYVVTSPAEGDAPTADLAFLPATLTPNGLVETLIWVV